MMSLITEPDDVRSRFERRGDFGAASAKWFGHRDLGRQFKMVLWMTGKDKPLLVRTGVNEECHP